MLSGCSYLFIDLKMALPDLNDDPKTECNCATGVVDLLDLQRYLVANTSIHIR